VGFAGVVTGAKEPRHPQKRLERFDVRILFDQSRFPLVVSFVLFDECFDTVPDAVAVRRSEIVSRRDTGSRGHELPVPVDVEPPLRVRDIESVDLRIGPDSIRRDTERSGRHVRQLTVGSSIYLMPNKTASRLFVLPGRRSAFARVIYGSVDIYTSTSRV